MTALAVLLLRPVAAPPAALPAPASPPVARPIVPPRPDGGPARLDAQIDPSLVDEVLDVAEDIDMQLASRLRSICDEDPQRFQQVMRQSGRRLLGLVHLRDRDPTLYQAKVQELQLQHRAQRLAVEYCLAARDGDANAAEVKRQEIRKLLQIQFGLTMKVRGDSLLRLKEQVRTIEDELGRDANGYDEWVDDRLARLIERSSRSDDCDPVDLP